MATVIVEKSWDEPIDGPTLLERAAEGLMDCLKIRDVEWVRSAITPDGRRTICTFEAPDAEAVRQSYREQGITFDQIWTAQTLEKDANGNPIV